MSESGGDGGPPSVVDEGTVRFGGCRIWYRVVGDLADHHPDVLPVLTLHGGPGLPHDSLEPLEDLARASGRPVVFYDQLGCGNSERRADPDAWNVGIFLEELAAVRHELGLDAVHLLGHSWGGLLAMEHALSGAEGLASLILVSAVACGETMLENRQSFYDAPPTPTREAIRRHEAAGTFDDPEYVEAMEAFHRRYTCRLDPWPDWLNGAVARMDVGANAAMWGPPGSPGVQRNLRQPGPAAQAIDCFSTRTRVIGWVAVRCVPASICDWQETPAAAIRVAGLAARTAGNRRCSPTCIEMA